MASKDQTKKNATNAKKGGLKDYLKGVRIEMSKVVWPTKKELGTFTGVVIATCAVFALGFWAIDTGVLAALKFVLGITLN
ncbi:MAG: preprotein translocase subunit SecE [Eubacteriaceae bacterium]|nr:preprotein translocase subunit SecE [Eubacteriaceae bacterium]